MDGLKGLRPALGSSKVAKAPEHLRRNHQHSLQEVSSLDLLQQPLYSLASYQPDSCALGQFDCALRETFGSYYQACLAP